MKVERAGLSNFFDWNFEIPKETKEFLLNDPVKFDRYFALSLGCSLFFVGLPFAPRVIANICQSVFFRGIDCLVNKKSLSDLLNLDLVIQVGAAVLMGEVAARLLRLHGTSASSQTPKMPITTQSVLQFKSASYEVKTRMIEAAYYDKASFETVMLALRDPELFAWHHKSMVVHELRAVLTTFHPERAASLERNLATVAERADIGHVYNRLFSNEYYYRMKHVLDHNFEVLNELKETPDFVGLIKTLIALG